jgi:ribose transport system substrate-binding protein
MVLLAAALLVGCDDKKKSEGGAPAPVTKTLKLAFVTNNASDFWKLAANGVHKYEKEAGIKVDIKMPPTGTVAEQNGILEDLVGQGYNGIAISVIAPDDQVKELDKAAAKTILICHDSDAAKSKRRLYIGTNNYEAGRALGKEIVKLLPDGGKMAVFVGTFSADNARERLRGIETEIKGKNIEIVARKEDNKDPGKAQSNVDDVIVAYKDIKLLCGLWSYNGPAIAASIERSGKKGKILSAVFDEEDGSLDGIEKGIVSCTVVQKPFQFGYLSSKMLHELATKGDAVMPKNPLVDTGVEVINTGNVKKFRADLAEQKK